MPQAGGPGILPCRPAAPEIRLPAPGYGYSAIGSPNAHTGTSLQHALCTISTRRFWLLGFKMDLIDRAGRPVPEDSSTEMRSCKRHMPSVPPLLIRITRE